MRKAWLCGGLAVLLAAMPAWADPTIDVGSHLLLAGTPGQTIQIWITGEGNLRGLDLFVQVGDGGPGLADYGLPAGTPGPSITGMNLRPAGGIFAGEGNQMAYPGIPQAAETSVMLTQGTVNARGLLADLTIDTTGFGSGAWPLMLAGVLPFSSLDGPYDTAGWGPGSVIIPIGVTNGSISIPGVTTWNASSGNWSDGICWSAGEPNAGRRANIADGAAATISQGGRSCSLLTVGNAPGKAGAVSMTGGALNTDIAYVGYAGAGLFTQSGGTHALSGSLRVGYCRDGNGTYAMAGGDLIVPLVFVGQKGRGTFTQSDGNHYVRQALSIATEGNSVGAYNLEGGTLFAGRIDVGGSWSGRGGTGTFVISGGHAILDDKLVVWNGSTARLGLGTVVNSNGGDPAIDLSNDGMLEVGDGNGAPVVYCLKDVTGNGGIVIGSGATLWVESLEQNSVRIDAGGTLVLAASNPELYITIARQNYALAVPEPGTVALIGLGGAILAWRRRRGVP